MPFEGITSWKNWLGETLHPRAPGFSEIAEVYCLVMELNTTHKDDDKLSQSEKHTWLSYIYQSVNLRTLGTDDDYITNKIIEMTTEKMKAIDPSLNQYGRKIKQ